MSTVKANTIEPASGGTVTIIGADLTTPALGTPASGTLTNCTGLPANTGLSGTTLASSVVNASLNAITPSGGTLALTGSQTISDTLLAGTSSGTYHTFRQNVTANAGNAVAEVQGNAGATVAIFYGVTGYGANAANAAMGVGFDNVTNRSIKAGGNIAGSGADAAEYENNGGLRIVKGQIVGFDANGVLTNRFDAAVRFGVKSTNPYLVGGDNWGAEDKIGRPPQPPQPPGKDANEQELQEHAQAMREFGAEKAAFDARLEAARQLVDRIAYCGKVPCNVTGAAPGDYIVAVNDGSGGIKGLPVRSPTFDQYRAAVGRVNRILPDGRAEIAVIVH